MATMQYHRKAFWALATILCATPVAAQDMKSLWNEMPDSMIPYLDKDARRNLVDRGNSGTTVKNLLGDTTTLDTLTADFMQVRLNNAVSLQLKRLNATDGSTRIAMVRTYAAPEKESTMWVYDTAWQLVGEVDLQRITASLVQKGDSMETQVFEDLKRQMPFVMPVATLSPSETNLMISLSTPLVDKEKRNSVKSIAVQKELKWNGETFK